MQRTVGPFSGSVILPVAVSSAADERPTPKQARGPGWRRTSRGFYVPSDTPRTTEQRIAEASVVVPAGGGVTGWAALRWMGGRWFEGTTHGGRTELPVTVAFPGRSARARPQTGIRVCAEVLSTDDLVTYDGLRLTSAVRSTTFAMRIARSLTESVVVAEMAMFSGLTSIAELIAYLDEHSGLTGNPLARHALTLAHENSWSPMETRLRMLWRLHAGLPPLEVNVPVFDLEGHHVATPDLLDLEAGLAIEYDGAEYHSGVRRVKDNRREDDLRDVGLSYLSVVSGELDQRGPLIRRLQRGRLRALAERRAPRWTTDKPSWWVSQETVAQRRASAAQVARGSRTETWEEPSSRTSKSSEARSSLLHEP